MSLVPIKIAESLQFKTILVFKLLTNQSFCLQIKMENFFVYFYSKKISSEFFVEQRAKSNQERAKTNDQQAKSNEQRAKTNEERAKTNEQQRAKSNEQRTKGNEQRAKSFTSLKSTSFPKEL